METEDLSVYGTAERGASAQLWSIEFRVSQGPASKPAGPGQTPHTALSQSWAPVLSTAWTSHLQCLLKLATMLPVQ